MKIYYCKLLIANSLLTLACGSQDDAAAPSSGAREVATQGTAPPFSADGAVNCGSPNHDGFSDYYYFEKLSAKLETPAVAPLARASGLTEVTSCAAARQASVLLSELADAALDGELQDTLPSTIPKIYDGITSSLPFVVRLNSSGGGCSGSLISAQWLVSAAHCFSAGGAQQVTVRNSNGTIVSPTGSAFVVRMPGYAGGTGDSRDLALVRSTGWLAPANTSSSWVRIFGRQLYTEALVRIYGYGASSGDGSGGGVLRMSARQVRVDASGTDFFRGDAVSGEGRPCKGDSGGPALTQTTSFPTVAGVFSWFFGYDSCPYEGAGFYYRQTGTASDWIMATINNDSNTSSDCVRVTESNYSYLRCW